MDDFEKYQKTLISGLTKIKAATPSDSVNLKTAPGEFYPRGILVTAGAVVIEDEAGNTTTFADGALAPGIWHPMRPVKIKTGTAATVYIGA